MIRLARPADASGVQAVYAPIVRETGTSFEIEVPAVAEMQRRIESTLERYPWLVCECDGRVVGYAYAGPHRARPAYQWTAETSVYVGGGFRRKGVASQLYAALFDDLRRRGYHMAVAGITLPNEASIALHERMGFKCVGVFHGIGYKLGAWRDVGWWEFTLQVLPNPPAAPFPPEADWPQPLTLWTVAKPGEGSGAQRLELAGRDSPASSAVGRRAGRTLQARRIGGWAVILLPGADTP